MFLHLFNRFFFIFLIELYVKNDSGLLTIRKDVLRLCHYKYQIRQKLFIKERALIFPDKLGKKRSLWGYKSTTQGVVDKRKIFSTGRKFTFLSPYYNLGNKLGWFREKDLIP